MKIKTIIAEDEFHSRERLRDLLSGFPELEIVGEAADGGKAVELIDTLRPDLAFLDIRMPVATGFEVLERIAHQPHIIFITAFDRYAVKAFEENAVDYILKPFSRERLARAVHRVRDLDKPADPRLIEALKESLSRREYMKRFAVKMGDEILIVPEEEVYYFNAETKYVLLYTDTGKYFIETTLKELEQVIDPGVFLRIHKSTIVSLDKIAKIRKSFRGDILVQLSDGKKTKLKVSRGCQPRLKEKLKF